MPSWTLTRIGGETRPDDWTVHLGVGSFARVHITTGGPQDGRWYWTAAWEDRQAGNGYEDTREEAMAAARAAIDAAR